MGIGIATISDPVNNPYATFWEIRRSECMRKEATGLLSWRILMVGNQNSDHSRSNFVDHRITQGRGRFIAIFPEEG